MKRFLGPYSAHIYPVMRIVIAFMYLSHGLRWLFGMFGGEPVPVLSLFGAAGVIETVAGTLMLVGFLTSWAAFIASGEMAVAYFISHVPRGSIFPIENGGEITVAFCFIFLFMASRGGGLFSVDAALEKR